MARLKRSKKQDADLDITSFMNLMIVLVPVLLLNMVFSQTAILDLKLPAGAAEPDPNNKENHTIELIIRENHMTLNYPAGVGRAIIEKKDGNHDYKKLSEVLQQLKPAVEEIIGKDKRDILLLSEAKTNYQTLVSVMDTVRSYKTVVVADVVDAELFPEISMGDAPELAGQAAAKGGATK